MHLSVWIPESVAAANPAVLSLARSAPAFHHLEQVGKIQTYQAIFAGLPQSLDLAVQLIGEVAYFPDARVTINFRPVANSTKFWSVLLCYQESLGEDDKGAYCSRRADSIGEAAGCPQWTCQARCQFICTRCHQVIREKGALPIPAQFQTIAVGAEVEWCPNLRLPD